MYFSSLLVRLFAAPRLIGTVFLVSFEGLAMVAAIEFITIGDGVVAWRRCPSPTLKGSRLGFN